MCIACVCVCVCSLYMCVSLACLVHPCCAYAMPCHAMSLTHTLLYTQTTEWTHNGMLRRNISVGKFKRKTEERKNYKQTNKQIKMRTDAPHTESDREKTSTHTTHTYTQHTPCDDASTYSKFSLKASARKIVYTYRWLRLMMKFDSLVLFLV